MKQTILPKTIMRIGLSLGLIMVSPALAAAQRPLVLELFTSQGCSSCPPADALLREMSKDANVLPLSFHVHYWDYLGWKDPYSSEANTDRQRNYSNVLSKGSLFTPQLIIDGGFSAVGSNGGDVSSAITQARKDEADIPITLTPDANTHKLIVHVGTGTATYPKASLYEIRYLRNAVTDVKTGENGGHTLENINNVTQIHKVADWNNKAGDYSLALNADANEGVAVLLQSEGQGRILSAGAYNP